MENTESNPRVQITTNVQQTLTALRKEVWQKSTEVDRLASTVVSIQSRVDHISKVYRILLGSVMVLSAIVLGIFIGLLVMLAMI